MNDPVFKGRVHKFGDDIRGDGGIITFSQIRDFSKFDTEALRKECMKAYDPDFPDKTKEGDAIVAGKDFIARGLMHEHAYQALRATGIRTIIAESFHPRFFLRFPYYGIAPIGLENAREYFDDGDEIVVDVLNHTIRNLTRTSSINFKSFPPHWVEILREGDFTGYLKKLAVTRGLIPAKAET